MLKKILVVDDEKSLRDFVSRNLSARGFQVFTAATGLEALAIFHDQSLDLIILDLVMPHMDGLETCRRIRQLSTVPIIILSALDENADKVTALDIGADDYLTKPFGVDELLARVNAMIRRIRWQGGMHENEIIRYADLELNTEAMTLKRDGALVKLTRTELSLLAFLMHHIGKVLPHRLLLQSVWGPEYGDESEYLRVYIGRLRRKIEVDPSTPALLFTEHGIGYRFGES